MVMVYKCEKISRKRLIIVLYLDCMIPNGKQSLQRISMVKLNIVIYNVRDHG